MPLCQFVLVAVGPRESDRGGAANAGVTARGLLIRTLMVFEAGFVLRTGACRAAFPALSVRVLLAVPLAVVSHDEIDYPEIREPAGQTVGPEGIEPSTRGLKVRTLVVRLVTGWTSGERSCSPATDPESVSCRLVRLLQPRADSFVGTTLAVAAL